MKSMISSGLTSDSREVKPGYLFVAIPGSKVDGRNYIADAYARGAREFVVPVGTERLELPDITWTEVENPRKYLALAAAQFYTGQPEKIVAVTGTNGKTSTVNFAEAIWSAIGVRAASLGTIGLRGLGLNSSGSMTTLDPVLLHQTLSDLSKKGVTHLAMEASSHGLEQNRLDAVKLCAAGFTNLTRDHLDYHQTMESYLAAKLRLFDTVLPEDGVAVVNADTTEYELIKADCVRRKMTCWGYGVNGHDIRMVDRELLPAGQRLKLDIFGQSVDVSIPLVGAFQAMNVLCALGLVLGAGGVETDTVLDTLPDLAGVPGRLQKVQFPKDHISVFIDYAHTPDGLENVLHALRPHTQGRLICVFGCGGDRDRGKRPVMGEIATRLADIAIVTDDNPRSEDPAFIRSEILAGAKSATEIGGRRNAIHDAVAMLKSGDVLVVAGKGHEQGQIFADHTEPFDDYSESLTALTSRFSHSPS